MRGSWCVWALWGLVACGDASAKEPRAAAPQHQARRVKLVHASETKLAERVIIAGTLAAQDEVVVRTKVTGRLASILVDLGTKVHTGQVLATIEPVDYRLRVEQASAALAQAKAQLGLAPEDDRSDVEIEQTTGVRQALATLAEARANFERSRTLVDKKLIGRADYDTANATFLRAESEVQRAREEVYGRLALLAQRKAELALARQQLADATVRSPLDGIVQVRGASAGELLAQGAPVATVVRVDPLRLRVEVPEREALRVAVGQEVSVRVEESERTYRGRVARLSPMLDPQSRTLVVEAELPNPEAALRPGSFARAVIELGEGAPVVTVPKSTIVVFAGIEKVILVEDGKAVERQVQTGRRVDELVEIVEGVRAGEAVVREPGTLQQGQPVIVEGDAAARSERDERESEPRVRAPHAEAR